MTENYRKKTTSGIWTIYGKEGLINLLKIINHVIDEDREVILSINGITEEELEDININIRDYDRI